MKLFSFLKNCIENYIDYFLGLLDTANSVEEWINVILHEEIKTKYSFFIIGWATVISCTMTIWLLPEALFPVFLLCFLLSYFVAVRSRDANIAMRSLLKSKKGFDFTKEQTCWNDFCGCKIYFVAYMFMAILLGLPKIV